MSVITTNIKPTKEVTQVIKFDIWTVTEDLMNKLIEAVNGELSKLKLTIDVYSTDPYGDGVVTHCELTDVEMCEYVDFGWCDEIDYSNLINEDDIIIRMDDYFAKHPEIGENDVEILMMETTVDYDDTEYDYDDGLEFFVRRC